MCEPDAQKVVKAKWGYGEGVWCTAIQHGAARQPVILAQGPGPERAGVSGGLITEAARGAGRVAHDRTEASVAM
eukprot:6487732-Prymnesium_polylepis.1